MLASCLALSQPTGKGGYFGVGMVYFMDCLSMPGVRADGQECAGCLEPSAPFSLSVLGRRQEDGRCSPGEAAGNNEPAELPELEAVCQSWTRSRGQGGGH